MSSFLKSAAPLGGLLAALALAAPAAHAGFSCNTKGAGGTCVTPTSTTINTPAGKRRTDAVFVGINWNFGAKSPELVLGFRGLRTNTSKKSDGYQLDLVLPFSSTISFDRVRLSYVGGQRSALGQLGLGYSFAQKSFLGNVALQAPYVTAGVDYLFSGSVLPYVGVNSLGRPRVPTSGASSTTLGCTSPATLQPADNFSGTVGETDGFTCFEDLSND